MKIHIIGCSGSDKTYLAKALSEKYNVPHFDLDDIQWNNNADGYGVKMPIEKRTSLLNESRVYIMLGLESVLRMQIKSMCLIYLNEFINIE